MFASARNMAYLFVCLFLLAPQAVRAGAPAHHLANSEYRFSVDIPPDAIGCTEGKHGFSILLHPTAGGCESSLPKAYVGVFGDYNSAFRGTPSEVLRDLCPQGAVPAAKSDLQVSFPGRLSAVCRKDASDGWIDVFVATQAGSWPNGFGLHRRIPYIDYTAQLHTRTSTFEKDMKTFRQVLSTVHIVK